LLDIYLRSGIPVILLFWTGGSGHAVTVAGYSAPQASGTSYPIEAAGNSYSVELRNLSADRIYIHDDRLGPYACARFEIERRHDNQGHDLLQLAILIEWPDGQVEKADVYAVAAPLYPKLRSNARELFETAVDMLPIVHTAVEDYEGELGLALQFERSGDYQAALYELGAAPARIGSFQQAISLSRYVGIHRWHLGKVPILDTVWDTTDTMRETKYSENLLGVVCLDDRFRALADGLANLYGALAG